MDFFNCCLKLKKLAKPGCQKSVAGTPVSPEDVEWNQWQLFSVWISVTIFKVMATGKNQSQPNDLGGQKSCHGCRSLEERGLNFIPITCQWFFLFCFLFNKSYPKVFTKLRLPTSLPAQYLLLISGYSHLGVWILTQVWLSLGILAQPSLAEHSHGKILHSANISILRSLVFWSSSFRNTEHKS